MRRVFGRVLLGLGLLFAVLAGCSDRYVDSAEALPRQAVASRSADLPPEALDTLELIQRGGPYPYRKDGTTFQNRERLLPARATGYYREYTVPTPGSDDRGARRIITGGDPPEVFYYTADHYRSFRRIEAPR